MTMVGESLKTEPAPQAAEAMDVAELVQLVAQLTLEGEITERATSQLRDTLHRLIERRVAAAVAERLAPLERACQWLADEVRGLKGLALPNPNSGALQIDKSALHQLRNDVPAESILPGGFVPPAIQRE